MSVLLNSFVEEAVLSWVDHSLGNMSLHHRSYALTRGNSRKSNRDYLYVVLCAVMNPSKYFSPSTLKKLRDTICSSDFETDHSSKKDDEFVAEIFKPISNINTIVNATPVVASDLKREFSDMNRKWEPVFAELLPEITNEEMSELADLICNQVDDETTAFHDLRSRVSKLKSFDVPEAERSTLIPEGANFDLCVIAEIRDSVCVLEKAINNLEKKYSAMEKEGKAEGEE